jgi:hypothetical protein
VTFLKKIPNCGHVSDAVLPRLFEAQNAASIAIGPNRLAARGPLPPVHGSSGANCQALRLRCAELVQGEIDGGAIHRHESGVVTRPEERPGADVPPGRYGFSGALLE